MNLYDFLKKVAKLIVIETEHTASKIECDDIVNIAS